MFDLFEVQFWAKMWCSEVFEVLSCCYVTRLVFLEHTVWCSRTVWFFVMFDMFEVRFWAKMWCSEVFEVWSCCHVTRLVLEHTVWCSNFDFGLKCDVRKVRCSDIQCSECSKFGILVFAPRLLTTKLDHRLSLRRRAFREGGEVILWWKGLDPERGGGGTWVCPPSTPIEVMYKEPRQKE